MPSSTGSLKRCIAYRSSVLGSDHIGTSSNVLGLQGAGGWSAYVKCEVFVSLIFDSKVEVFNPAWKDRATVTVALDGSLELASRY